MTCGNVTSAAALKKPIFRLCCPHIARTAGLGWMPMLRYTIGLPPISKKNSQQILVNRATGRPFIMPSKAYKDYEAKAMWYIHPKPENPIDRPVNVKCLFYTPTHRRVDLVNLLEAAEDILVRAKVLADDNANIVVSMDGSRVLYDKTAPRTEIEITEV